MNKKTKIAIIGIIAALLVTIGITYAYWLITRTQQGENVITTGCLDITLNGENDITLSNQFPLSDEDGMKLTPYTFTVTNNCNTSVNYQVALEAVDVANVDEISSNALKVSLNDSTKLYSEYSDVATTVSGAYESRIIGFSRLAAKGSDGSTNSHNLRIWIDKDASTSEMNKTFKSKVTVTVGQGIESSYEEGTLAYDILANYGGSNAANEIDVTEYDHRVTANGIQYISTSSNYNYYYGTSYTYDEETRKYTLDGTIVQAQVSECRAGTKTCGKYTLKNTSSTYSSTTLYEVTDFQSSGNYVTANTINYVNEFSSPATTEASLNKAPDDYGTSYYFRGDVENNYVKLGTWNEDNAYYRAILNTSGLGPSDEYETLEACQAEWGSNEYYTCTKFGASKGDAMYWRIVRINGDGTVRLVYDGTTAAANNETHYALIDTTAYNTKRDDVKYIGYTYDTSDTDTTQIDSTIKGVVEAWYENNLEAKYGKYVADRIFCNDRAKTNIAGSMLFVGTYERIYNINKKPILTCTRDKDKYTVSNTNGNGLLRKPIGLMTADEIVMAGGINGADNSNFYLYTGADQSSFCSMTPYDSANSITNYPDIFGLSYSGSIGSGYAGARPVINLKADVKFTGNGTIDSPYEIVME